MSILSDKEIQTGAWLYELLIPFKEEQLNPHGYDLSLKAVWINGKLHIEDEIEIPSKTFFIVNTVEMVNLKEQPDSLIAKLWIRTTFARQGIILSDGLIDCGFKGTINLCCYNASSSPIYLQKNVPFCQIAFERVEAPENDYSERSGHYQNQKTVMLAEGEV